MMTFRSQHGIADRSSSGNKTLIVVKSSFRHKQYTVLVKLFCLDEQKCGFRPRRSLRLSCSGDLDSNFLLLQCRAVS